MEKENALNLAYICLVEYEYRLRKEELPNKKRIEKQDLIKDIIENVETLLKKEGIIL